MAERYICKECQAPATVDTNGAIWRTCSHTGTILLDMTVTCTGEGGASETPSRLSRIVALVIAIVKGKPV